MSALEDTQGQYHSYLVRIWQERLNPKQVETSRWQGEVIHIQTGTSWLVQDIELLMGLLNNFTFPDEL